MQAECRLQLRAGLGSALHSATLLWMPMVLRHMVQQQGITEIN